jgi:WD40 repeat protein
VPLVSRAHGRAASCALALIAHTRAEMVTCLDVVGQTVVSGSIDNTLALWDLRQTDRATQAFRPLQVAGGASVRVCRAAWGAAWGRCSGLCLPRPGSNHPV